MLNYHSKDNKKSAQDIAKQSGINAKEINVQFQNLVHNGLMKEVESTAPQKYQLNDSFNFGEDGKPIQSYISFLPTAEEKLKEDEQRVLKLDL